MKGYGKSQRDKKTRYTIGGGKGQIEILGRQEEGNVNHIWVKGG